MSDNKKLADQLNEIWSNGNTDKLDTLFTSDFIFHNPAPEITADIQGYKNLLNTVRAAFPDYKDTIDFVMEDGDKVAYRFVGKGTHKGEFMGTPPSNKEIQLTGITIIRIADGKVAEEWTEMDMSGIMS